MLEKTYIIATEFPSGVRRGKLLRELREALPGKVDKIRSSKTAHTVIFSEDVADVSAIDAAVAAHEPHKSLAGAKAKKSQEIDKKTRKTLRSATFVHNGKTFSCSADAQLMMVGFVSCKSSLSYPVEIDTSDNSDKIALANQAELEAFHSDMIQAVQSVMGAGTGLKDSVRNASDQAQVSSVFDNR